MTYENHTDEAAAVQEAPSQVETQPGKRYEAELGALYVTLGQDPYEFGWDAAINHVRDTGPKECDDEFGPEEWAAVSCIVRFLHAMDITTLAAA